MELPTSKQRETNMKNERYHQIAAGLLGASLIAGCSTFDEARDTDDLAARADSTYAPLHVASTDAQPIDGQYIVVFDEGAPASALRAAASRIALTADAGRVHHLYSVIPGFAAELTPQALDALRRNPDVAYVEQDYRVSIDTATPTDADGIDRVDQRQRPRNGYYENHGRTGDGVHIYIIDTGIRTSHEEIAGRVGSGFTAIDDGRGVEDCNGHGTHVASTTAGANYGMARAATVHPVRVLTCEGSGSYSTIIAGVDFVREDCPAQNGPCVANMSLGGPASSALDEAVTNAVKSGVTIAVAAGNSNISACNVSPARAPAVLTVAAVDDNDAKASFSDYGSCVDIWAPGVSILGADIGSDTDTQVISGTSMASPHVAGAAAQYLSANPGATPADVEAALEGTASTNCVSGNPSGTPNLLLYNGFGDPPFSCGNAPPPGDATCTGRCGKYDGKRPCQCDWKCIVYGDCCNDLCLWSEQ